MIFLVVVTLLFIVAVAKGILPLISLVAFGVIWFGVLLAYVGMEGR